MRHPFSLKIMKGGGLLETFAITELTSILNHTPCAAVLGNFDGVHIGHQTLLEEAKKSDLTPAVFTFSGKMPSFLTTTKEREALFEAYGAQLLFLAPFPLMKDLSCRRFVIYLKEKLACRHLICGFNFRFGKGAVGNAETLKSLAEELGLSCTILPAKTEHGVTVSSSVIRTLLSEGKIEEANRLLGRPHAISGKVSHGFSVGRRLQVPTLNLPLPEGSVPLCHGVYVSEAVIDGTTYPAITNIGSNPTFQRGAVTCETNLLDTEGDFYNKDVTVHLLAFVRQEKKFDSFDDLKEAIARDLVTARAYHQMRKQ